jgi:hypothetical protein
MDDDPAASCISEQATVVISKVFASFFHLLIDFVLLLIL